MVVGVDPGQANCGVAVLDAATLELLDAHTDFLCTRAAFTDIVVGRASISLVRRLQQKFPSIEQVVIESQYMGTHNKATQAALSTAALALIGEDAASVVSPMTVKAHFRRAGLGFNGHAQNKTDALEAVRRMGYTVRDDHQADAILLALYWADVRDSAF